MHIARMLFVSALLGVLVACPGCTMWKQKPANAWSNATGGEHFERLMWRDVKEKQWEDFERHLAPSFVSLDQNGTHDRAAMVEIAKSVVLNDYTLGDFKVESNGADMVVTYTAQMKGTYHGQSLPAGPMRMMTVWQQVTKGWLAIVHSETPQSSSR